MVLGDLSVGAMPVRLTRRVRFSSGLRFWNPALTDAENRARFGSRASPFNHGHDFLLEATLEGPLDPKTGMVVNISEVARELKGRIVAELDSKSLNDEVEAFGSRPPTLENVLLFIHERLAEVKLETTHGRASKIVGLRLEQSPTLCAELSHRNGNWTMTLSRSYSFSAGHRLYSESFDEKTNWELYGKDSYPSGHGHNFDLDVILEGEPDPETGLIADLETLDSIVKTLIIERYDHRNLNTDFEEFKGKVTTCEVMLQEIWKLLDGKLPAKLAGLRLTETGKNVFEMRRA